MPVNHITSSMFNRYIHI